MGKNMFGDKDTQQIIADYGLANEGAFAAGLLQVGLMRVVMDARETEFNQQSISLGYTEGVRDRCKVWVKRNDEGFWLALESTTGSAMIHLGEPKGSITRKVLESCVSQDARTVSEDGDECPACQNGTVEVVDGEVRCRGECGSIWKR